jgi:type 1 fimbria pilin
MMMSRLTGLLCLMLALLLPATGWAACTGAAQSFPIFAQPNVPVFNPTLPDGTVLWSSGSLSSSLNTSVSCSPFGTVLETGAPGATYNATYKAFSTSVPGVGIQITDQAGNILPYSNTMWSNSSSTFSIGIGFTLKIIKTGPITAGGAITGNIFQYSAQSGTYPIFYVYLTGPIVVNPTIPTCAVTTPAITVPLGNVAQSSFTDVGSTSPAQSFNIGLNCSGGAAGVTASVYTTLTDQNNPGNVSDKLSLTSSSTAKGIGIQVLNGTTVIKYGSDSKVIGNQNQWVAGQTGNGSFNIPLTARYVQTATTVTAGSANGIATFTMGYQ